MRSKTPLYSLTRGLIRASWNKYNLFNLSRKQTPTIHNKTLYQQKWAAKKETRAYHGEHINERQFKTLWDKRLVGVAGAETRDRRTVPLASQTFASIEKRLDMAIFRALFASSARQAKQLVIHGKVKVNGRRVNQAGMVLRPGDLFEVEPAAVLMNVSSPTVGTPPAEEGAKASEDDAEAETAQENSKAAAAETVGEVTGESAVVTGSGSGEGATSGYRANRRAFWTQVGRQGFVPKPFMSAFAFVPDYLEVSYETCSAVYLRDPVAKPGFTEVPSPLPTGVHALAGNFYLRGR